MGDTTIGGSIVVVITRGRIRDTKSNEYMFHFIIDQLIQFSIQCFSSITVEFQDGDEETISSRQMPTKDVRVEAHLCIQTNYQTRESAEELLQLLRVS